MYVYLLTNNNHHFKIGISKNPETRVKQLQTGNSEKIELVFKYFSKNHSSRIESALHNRYSNYRLESEWFSLPTKETLTFMNVCEKMESNFRFLDENKI